MGMAFSAHLLAIKLGLAIGAAATGWILSGTGYVANAVQSPEALAGIRLCFAGIPALIGFILFWLMTFYKLDDETMDGIHAGQVDDPTPAVVDHIR